MKTPGLSPNEELRLQSLLKYEILDTDPEPSFDDMTLLASQICQAPVALVSLIDSKRQWFKSRRGVDITEAPRDISFCGHTILETDVFVVEDARDDERFVDNPLVTGETAVRFYAGAPLVNSGGFALGALCVIDQTPRKLSREQLDSLRALAREVVRLLDLRAANITIRKNFDELQKYSKIIADQHIQLTYSAKMASLGEMAGGIAHEINNPLSIIIGRVDLLLRKLQPPTIDFDRVVSELDKINTTALRVAKIVKGLRIFSRTAENDPVEKVKLADLVGDATVLCKERFLFANVDFEVIDLPEVEMVCRPAQISQALLNLLNNAFDAIQSLPEKWIRMSFEMNTEKNCVSIFVTDSGPGIPAEIAEKIMQPFFTTKEVGKGTGLGLSIARGFTESNGGKLYIDTAHPNTRFVVELSLKLTATR